MRTKELAGWQTPATSYPRTQLGAARITDMKYRGMYHAFGTRPLGKQERYDYYNVAGSIRVTGLKINGKTWMVDDPPHWWSIQERASQYHGHVLCAGLGLGLIVHALEANPKGE